MNILLRKIAFPKLDSIAVKGEYKNKTSALTNVFNTISCFLFVSLLNAQSPNSIAETQHVDIPEGAYTGRPAISIPLYTIQDGNVKIPISIAYYGGGGIKLNQESGSVGLGWALNAGGIITRQIRGIDDFFPSTTQHQYLKGGYYHRGDNLFPAATSENLPVTPENFSDDDHRNYVNILKGRADGAPDVFSFNFMGYSGKFIFDHSSFFPTPILLSQNPNLRISLLTDENGYKYFEITDAKDWVYTFSMREYSYNQTLMGTFSYANSMWTALEDKYIRSAIVTAPEDRHISAWHLSQIRTPTNEVISFIYAREVDYYSQPESIINYDPVQNEVPDTDTFISTNMPYLRNEDFTEAVNFFRTEDYYGKVFPGYCSAVHVTEERKLNRIDFNNGSVFFEYKNAREDLDAPGTYLPFNKEGGTNSLLYIGASQHYELAREKYEWNVFSNLYEKETPRNHVSKSLQRILVKDKNDKLVKGINFYQSYDVPGEEGIPEALGTPNELRLVLDSIATYYEHKTATKNPYRFTYNNPRHWSEITNLYGKNSNHHDYWGYPSEKAGYGLVKETPFFDLRSHSGTPIILDDELGVNDKRKEVKQSKWPLYISRKGNTYVHLNGSNREPDVATVQKGILQKIQYPNGGITKYTYEPNDYSSSEPLFNYIEHRITLAASESSKTKSYTLTDKTLVSFEFGVIPENGKTTQETAMGSRFVLKKNGVTFMEILPEHGSFNENPTDSFFREHTFSVNTLLPAGNYTLEAIDGSSTNRIFFEVNYHTLQSTTNKLGAGVRIKSIEKMDSNEEKTYLKTIFSYADENGISTGKLLTPYRFGYNEDLVGKPLELANTLESSDWIFESDEIIRTANNVTPMSVGTEGVVIGYDAVSVSQVDSTGNTLGSSVYHFENSPVQPVIHFLPNVPNHFNSLNGKLLKKEVFNNDGNKVREDNYAYETDEAHTVTTKSLSVFDLTLMDETPVEDRHTIAKVVKTEYDDFDSEAIYSETLQSDYTAKFYDNTSKWSYLKSRSSTVYDVNGNNPVTTTTNYVYTTKYIGNYGSIDWRSKFMEEKHVIYNNGADTIKTIPFYKNTYPLRIERQEVYKNNVLLNSQKTEFLNSSNIPTKIQASKGTFTNAHITEDIQFFDYTIRYNVGSSLNNGVYTYYIWGYRDEYLLAEITSVGEPIDLTSIQSLITTAQEASDIDYDNCSLPECKEQLLRNALDAIRNHTLLKQASMTSYTYDPLLGKTSETDSRGETLFFKNDYENQKNYVLDKDGNVISEQFNNQLKK